MDTLTTNWLTLDAAARDADSCWRPRGRSRRSTDFKPSIVWNWSFGVQRALPWKLTGDLAYVGNTPRNVARNIPINDLTPEQLLDPRVPGSDAELHAARSPRTTCVRTTGSAGSTSAPTSRTASPTSRSRCRCTRRMSNGFAFSVAYTGTRSKGLRDWDWYRTEADNRARLHALLPAAGRTTSSSATTTSFPGVASSWATTPSRGRARRLADLGRDVDDRWHARRLQLRVHGRADRRPHAGAGRLARRPDVRPEPAARRADVRSAVPHRVRRGRQDR